MGWQESGVQVEMRDSGTGEILAVAEHDRWRGHAPFRDFVTPYFTPDGRYIITWEHQVKVWAIEEL